MNKNINIEDDIQKIEVGKCIAYNISVGRFSYYIKATLDIYPCKIKMMIKLATKKTRVNNCFAIAERNENNLYTLSFYRVEKNEDEVKIAKMVETERKPCFFRRWADSEATVEKGIINGLKKIL